MRVVDAGAGVRLPERASPVRIRTAIGRALTEPALQAGARRMQQAFARDGTGRTVAILEAMVADPRVPR